MPRKKKTSEEAEDSILAVDVPKLTKTPQLVKGMKDLLPADQGYWEYIRETIKTITGHYGFERLDTPILEDLALYVHSVGRQTDIVEKEMFTFTDQGGSHLALRPEFTAGFTRAYIEHGMLNLPQPVKLYTVGPLYRHEKPQEGRLRQHHQFNCEVFGEKGAAVDAQLILMAQRFYRLMGLQTMLHINSIGCAVCRETYKTTLIEYYKAKKNQLCEDCKRRYAKNPLRLLDCKNEECQPFKAEAPQIVDFLCEECKDHFVKLLEFIDEFEIPYQLNPHLVRGMDYYTRTVFEFYTTASSEDGKMMAIGGGGRYDMLAETLGGRPTPACGFGIGLERVIIKMREAVLGGADLPVGPKKKPVDIFFAQLAEQAKRLAMVLYEGLIDEGLSVAESFSKDSLKAQLELANKLGVRFTLILGQQELLDGTIIIRNMEGGEQEVIDSQKLVTVLQKKLGQASASTTRKEGE